MVTKEYVCPRCKHFWWTGCAAFPEEIPIEIRTGEDRHDKPFKGDNGIQFTPLRGFSTGLTSK